MSGIREIFTDLFALFQLIETYFTRVNHIEQGLTLCLDYSLKGKEGKGRERKEMKERDVVCFPFKALHCWKDLCCLKCEGSSSS